MSPRELDRGSVRDGGLDREIDEQTGDVRLTRHVTLNQNHHLNKNCIKSF